MADPQVIDRFDGDTLEFTAELRTAKPITAEQWDGATGELLSKSAREPYTDVEFVDDDSVFELDLTPAAPDWKLAKLTLGVMPPAGASYLFRVRVTFSDDTVQTFPDGEEWNVLRVHK